jgi:hypothetical protein
VQSVKLGPRLLGDAPKINVVPSENEMAEEEGSSEVSPAIKVYDDDINMKFLLCGVPSTPVSFDTLYELSALLASYVVCSSIQLSPNLIFSCAGSLFAGLIGRWSECASEY